MSNLPCAHDFVINGGDFSAHHVTNNNIPTTQENIGSGIDILLSASVPDATVDAEARQYAPRCFPHTREQYIHDIVHWATASTDETTSPIYWMRGPPGVGKSAIAQTCAERLKEAGHLGAAFFFSINGRDDYRTFFPTLAYQLSTIFSEYRRIVGKQVFADNTLIHKNLSSQFNSLIVQPLQELKRHKKALGRRAIIIDGLDECQSNDAQVEIINIISESVRSQTTPFRWAIFSRPEPHIKSIFDSRSVSSLSRRVLLPISREVDGEIEFYLRSGFQNILARRDLLSLSKSWPTPQAIQKLVDAAAGLFAYAAAVLRFVDSRSFVEFQGTLQTVLDTISSSSQCCPSLPSSPFSELDKLYTLVMRRIPEGSALSLAQLFLAMVISFSGKAAIIANVQGLSEAEFRGICHQLSAVVELQDTPESLQPWTSRLVQTGSGDPIAGTSESHGILYIQDKPTLLSNGHGTVRFHHKSFLDFLRDSRRSKDFCITSRPLRERLFNCLVERHHHFSRHLSIRDHGGLDLSLDVPDSSLTLSWPVDHDEGSNSLLQLVVLNAISSRLSYAGEELKLFIDEVSPESLRKLATLDYRKSLVSERQVFASEAIVIQPVPMDIRRAPPMGFTYRNLARNFCREPQGFDAKEFYKTIKKLQRSGVIRRCRRNLKHRPWLALERLWQSLGARWSNNLEGSHKLGHGEKAIVCLWLYGDIWEGCVECRWYDHKGGIEAIKRWMREMFDDSASNIDED